MLLTFWRFCSHETGIISKLSLCQVNNEKCKSDMNILIFKCLLILLPLLLYLLLILLLIFLIENKVYFINSCGVSMFPVWFYSSNQRIKKNQSIGSGTIICEFQCFLSLKFHDSPSYRLMYAVDSVWTILDPIWRSLFLKSYEKMVLCVPFESKNTFFFVSFL